MTDHQAALKNVEYPDEVGISPDKVGIPPFQPYIPAGANLREFTLLPLIIGTLLGIVFGASSLYLVLKVGLTVSASIPVAVISITFFRILSKFGGRNATILENNVVQTAGSAGESIAFGIGVTMPAIMILGFELEIYRVLLVGVLGGLLGILMMIPLRRALIVQQHGKLKYPEGTACAEVLKAGASKESIAAHAQTLNEPVEAAEQEAGTDAKTIFGGFGIGFVYKVLNIVLAGWKDVPEKVFKTVLPAGSVGVEISPELLGVGYIIGPRIAAIMCAGGVLAFLVLIPAIKFFGQNATGVIPPGTIPISQMDPHAIRIAYVQYIAAGAVAAGGIISLIRSMPTIWHGLKAGLSDLKGSQAVQSVLRTERDMSMKTVLGGIVGLIAVIMLARPLHMNFLGALLIVAFGFLFVTVSSRLTGEIGSSSNPISGMTVATLLITSLIFLALGWTGSGYYVTALSVGAIVCIAASNGGTTSQDLKTGFLIGATPRYQQMAILIGALASAVVLGPILLRLNDAQTVYVPRVTHIGGKTQENFPATLKAPADQIAKTTETLRGPQAKSDARAYHVWQHTDAASGQATRFLVDDAGTPVYLVDPGINGSFNVRPDGSTVKKFDAPKATLMSYIIKGILNRQLPWGLVILGVMISLVLEMSGIPSLAFAVGVYLPLSSSTPILIGGVLRGLTDRYLARKYARRNLTEEQLVAEGDKSPGVLLASGYIAGGAIAGIIYALMSSVLADVNSKIQNWSTAHNPFFAGDWSNLLSSIPFVILCGLLFLVGREVLFRRKDPRPV